MCARHTALPSQLLTNAALPGAELVPSQAAPRPIEDTCQRNRPLDVLLLGQQQDQRGAHLVRQASFKFPSPVHAAQLRDSFNWQGLEQGVAYSIRTTCFLGQPLQSCLEGR